MGMTSKEYHEGYQQGFKDAKADYETRLKADLVAMLEELQLEINKAEWHNHYDYIEETFNNGLQRGGKIIQQKIGELKGEQE